MIEEKKPPPKSLAVRQQTAYPKLTVQKIILGSTLLGAQALVCRYFKKYPSTVDLKCAQI